MKNKIKKLYSKDDKLSYSILLELEKMTEKSNKLYPFFDELLEMLNNEKSFVRVRGFRLICSLAKWDKYNKIDKNINIILKELDDNKGTSIRQCLSKMKLLLTYKKKLSNKIIKKLENIDLSKYKDSMQPLIKKDIDNILSNKHTL